MNNFETNDRANDITQSMTPYAMAKRIIELEGKRQAPAVPDVWCTELKQIADTLDRDGDEYGCAARIYGLLKRDQVTGPAAPDALRSAFITAESGNGQYQIVARFKTLLDLHESHDYLVRLIAAVPQPPAVSDATHEGDPS